MKGAYCLEMIVSADSEIKIGALGKIHFKKGKYVYVGSAMNSLEKRIGRHLQKNKKKHWHIDYLLANNNVKTEKAYFIESPKKIECALANWIAEKGDLVNGFGYSDCKCNSHLFRVAGVSFIEGNNLLGKFK